MPVQRDGCPKIINLVRCFSAMCFCLHAVFAYFLRRLSTVLWLLDRVYCALLQGSAKTDLFYERKRYGFKKR